MSKSRFAILAVAVTTAVLAFATSTASAATSGAHFFSATGAVADNGALVVTFDEAGVGQQTVNLSLSATGNATYACLNGGGNHPKAANKETVTGPFGGSGTFGPDEERPGEREPVGWAARVEPDLPVGTDVRACMRHLHQHRAHGQHQRHRHHHSDVTRTFFNIGAPC
jgi:hypothetical protein